MSTTQKDVYLVIGGSGFLGRHIVEALLARGDAVSVFDIVQRYHDVPFYTGDISEEGAIGAALDKSGASCIIHTASPPHGVKDDALYWRVNVDGTRAVLDAAAARGVRKLVFTSSAGVVFNGDDLVNVDERLPPPEKAMDAYNESKAKAEALVLAANGKNGLLTVALRPAGIFGPGDRQVMKGLSEVYERGQTHFQIGDNTNLFDWTYVGNVAHAHLLAADKLVPAPEDAEEAEKQRAANADLLTYPLPPVDKSTGSNRVPTSRARPLGPYIERPANGDELEAAWDAPRDPRASTQPVVRSRFDPLAAPALARAAPRDPLAVAGNVFFVSNGEPVYFWDLPRAVWTALAAADKDAPPPRGVFRMPKEVGLALATVLDWWGWASGREPALTRFRVSYSCAKRWHNIEKARRVLGYEPLVGMDEGVRRMVKWWLEEHGKKA